MDLTQHTEDARTLDERIAEMKAEVETLAQQRKEIGDFALERLLSELKDGIELFGWDAESIIDEIVDHAGKTVSVRPEPQAASTRKPANSGGGKTVFAFRKDKELRYSGRGRLPEWMYTAMSIDGVDPDDKKEVRRWKHENLIEVAA